MKPISSDTLLVATVYVDIEGIALGNHWYRHEKMREGERVKIQWRGENPKTILVDDNGYQYEALREDCYDA